MSRKTDIPCAQSEPLNTEDAVISALLWRAGELLRRRQSSFQTLFDNLLTHVENDGELARLLEELPQTLGSGIILQPLFARLFPQQPQPIAVDLTGRGRPKLGRREVEILQEMAKGRSKKEIAEHLFISPGTVKKHFDNLYAKLEVDNPQEAVAKAVALGLLTFDFADLVQPMRDRRDLNFNTLAHLLLHGTDAGREQGWNEPTRQLALLGLLLFLLMPLHELGRRDRVSADRLQTKGVVFEFTPDGHLVRSFDGQRELRRPGALAFAPPAAERHGFRAGNLFLSQLSVSPNILNNGSVVELTSDGEYVRTFTGGAYLSTRLTGGDIAFMSDGRLLATSGGFTDAVLEFSDGGRVVRRFAHLVPVALTVDRRGNAYMAGGTSRGHRVHVFNPQGNLLRRVGATVEDGIYRGMAVDDEGNLFVANQHDHAVEIYAASGRRLGSIKGSSLHRPYRLALSPSGNLYVLPADSQNVKVFSPSHGVVLFSFSAPPNVHFNDLTFGPNGNLFVAGSMEDD